MFDFKQKELFGSTQKSLPFCKTLAKGTYTNFSADESITFFIIVIPDVVEKFTSLIRCSKILQSHRKQHTKGLLDCSGPTFNLLSKDDLLVGQNQNWL